MPVRFDVVSQGEELVSGAGVDTNAAWICGQLGGLGLVPARVSVVGDSTSDIADVLREASRRSPLVVCTGGLGPTSDDLTRDAAAIAFDRPLVESAEALNQIETRYRSRNREMPGKNRVQALLPTGATLLENFLGTAPGFSVDTGDSLLFFLPGVPFEMKPMVRDYVLNAARERFALAPTRTVVIRCIGLAESIAATRMDGFEREGVVVGYRASFPEVQVKLHVSGASDADALTADALTRLGDYVFGVDTGPLAEVVGSMLIQRGQTLATAESCTAGRISSEIAAISGASRYLLGGAVVYSNGEKQRQCGVPADVIATHGAVSEAVANALAAGIRSRTGADWGLAITGIAGPSGGSPDKPVGTVHMAVSGPGATVHRRIHFPYDRTRNIAMSSAMALDLLRRTMLNTIS